MATAVALPGARVDPVPAPAAPRRRRWGLAYLAWAVAQAVQLVLLHALDRRFFWLDDSQTQFGPTTWWMGAHLRDGRPPLADPDQGLAGNLTADMQYGALDPLHWAWQALAGRTDDVLVMAWVFGATCVASVGAGSLWLLLHHRVRPALAVPAAVGLATTGFFLWFGSTWWPMMWSTAWLPWMWVAFASRRWPGALLAGVATWAVLASGNPYAVPFAALVVVGQLGEAVWRHRSPLALLAPRLLARVVACFGGLLIALPTLLNTFELTPLLGRGGPEPVMGNSGFGVPSLLDVAVGGTTLLGFTNAWSGDLDRAPALAAMVLSLPLLALVRWRTALRSPGVPTAALVGLAALVATQLPTTLGLFRYPLRYTVVFQLFLGLFAVLAVTAAPLLTRRRLVVAGGLVAVQGLLALSRTPVFWRWHALAVLVAAAALAAAVLALRARRGTGLLRPVLGAVLVVATGVVPLVGVQMMKVLQERAAANGQSPASFAGLPFRELFAGYQQGTTTAEYRARSYATDTAITTYRTSIDPDRGWASGILGGSSNLLAELRVGTGSLAVWHVHLNSHLPRDYQGNLVGDPAQWTAPAGRTGQTWLDLASSDTVVIEADGPPALQEHFAGDPAWRLADGGPPNPEVPADRWLRYERDDGLPGRITAASGVAVDQTGWTAGLGYSGQVQDAYTVSTPDGPGRLVTRITDWPGYTATLDGRPLRLSSVDGALIAVDLPAGLDAARLEISFAPLGDRVLVPMLVAGGLVLLLGAALPVLAAPLVRRAGRSRAAGASPAAAAAGALPGPLAGLATSRLVHQAAKFFLGSLAGLTVDLSVFAVGTSLGLPPWAANTLSAGCAVVTVYALVTRYAFGSQASRATFVAFVTWYALSIIVFSALIDGLVSWTGWPAFVCKLVTLPPSFAANYLFSRRIFRAPALPAAAAPSAGEGR